MHLWKSEKQNPWILKSHPYQYSSSLSSTVEATPSADPWRVSLAFDAAAGMRLLFQSSTKTRGTQRTIKRPDRNGKASAPSWVLHHWLVQASQQRKLQYKRKSWFQVHIWNVSVSPCACLISVQRHCFRKGLSDSSLWLQRCNTHGVSWQSNLVNC